MFNRISRSWFTILFIAIVFEVIHTSSLTELSIDFFRSRIEMGLLITLIAYRHGIKASILFHMIFNTLVSLIAQSSSSYIGLNEPITLTFISLVLLVFAETFLYFRLVFTKKVLF